MNSDFEIVSKNIKERRTLKAQFMNGEKIEDEVIMELLELADCAPTHGRTEPWRFNVFSGAGFEDFCTFHSKIYWEETEEGIRNPTTRDLFGRLYETASHLIVVSMKRTPKVKIPDFEEYAACSAAVQNILLGAEALGLASIWNTGGKTYSPSMKKYLNLEEEDQVVALVYLGKSNPIEDRSAKRRIPLNEKTQWHR